MPEDTPKPDTSASDDCLSSDLLASLRAGYEVCIENRDFIQNTNADEANPESEDMKRLGKCNQYIKWFHSQFLIS